MRVLKFRDWHFKKKKMIQVNEINGLDMYYDGRMFLGMNSLSGKIGIQGEPHNDCIIMQYTGLVDKNGREIYEGDIVKAVSSNYPHQSLYASDVICNEEEGCRFEVRSGPGYCHGLSISWGGWSKIEVMGNIYEKPELLANI